MWWAPWVQGAHAGGSERARVRFGAGGVTGAEHRTDER
ncbi:hypothetical protein SFR_3759 [Streptomyces sp. FR-008]|nr:hypothetical protein SFR_3759 [Streptomyces sp. FR-008]